MGGPGSMARPMAAPWRCSGEFRHGDGFDSRARLCTAPDTGAGCSVAGTAGVGFSQTVSYLMATIIDYGTITSREEAIALERRALIRQLTVSEGEVLLGLRVENWKCRCGFESRRAVDMWDHQCKP